MDKAFTISPDQATKLVALCSLLKERELSFRADDSGDEQAAHDALCDIGEELALQMVGY